LWILVATRTTLKAMSGEIFFAPCLSDLKHGPKKPDIEPA
jgi:hypothetical protein